MRLEEETAHLKKEVASLKIQVHLRELEREAWHECAKQLAEDLRLYNDGTPHVEATLAKYAQLSRPDSDYVWPE